MSVLNTNNFVRGFWQVVLITSSVLLAFAINSWNDNRKAKIGELETLRIIRESVAADIADMMINANGYAEREIGFKYVSRTISTGLYNPDSLENSLSEILNPMFFISNPGPFETLKARGMEIISNDSLRNMLSRYYQISHQTINVFENHILQHNYSFVKGFVLEKFDFEGSGAKPINLINLKSDKSLSGKLGYSRSLVITMRETYLSEISKAEYLLDYINYEIEKQE